MKDNVLLYGKNSVYERLKSRPSTIHNIFVQEGFGLDEIGPIIRENNIAVKALSPRELSRLLPAKDSQGIMARVDRFEYTPIDNIVSEKKLSPIFLDRVTDPHNLGVIIRTSACFGGFGIVIPRHEACEVNETVLHVASGGENYVPVALVSNIPNAIIKVKKYGYWVLGAVLDEQAQDIGVMSLPAPLAIVLGSEGSGIRYGIEKQLDLKARIPMEGAQLSFNVNMACAIFCHEIAKRRRSK